MPEKTRSDSRFVTTRSGVRVCRDYRDNFIIDCEHPILRWKSGIRRESCRINSEVFSRLGSENSEDALTWNFFRTLQKGGMISQALGSLPVLSGKAPTVLFWGRDPEAPGDPVRPIARIQDKLDQMEPWGRGGRLQQTEPDVMVLTGQAAVAIECKLGRSGSKVKAWSRSSDGMRPEYRAFVEKSGMTLFESEFDWERDGHRYYQLMRNWVLVNALSVGRASYLVAIVNDKTANSNGGTHAEEFDRFRSFIPYGLRDRASLVTWQELHKRVAHGSDALTHWMAANRALGL